MKDKVTVTIGEYTLEAVEVSKETGAVKYKQTNKDGSVEYFWHWKGEVV